MPREAFHDAQALAVLPALAQAEAEHSQGRQRLQTSHKLPLSSTQANSRRVTPPRRPVPIPVPAAMGLQPPAMLLPHSLLTPVCQPHLLVCIRSLAAITSVLASTRRQSCSLQEDLPFTTTRRHLQLIMRFSSVMTMLVVLFTQPINAVTGCAGAEQQGVQADGAARPDLHRGSTTLPTWQTLRSVESGVQVAEEPNTAPADGAPA